MVAGGVPRRLRGHEPPRGSVRSVRLIWPISSCPQSHRSDLRSLPKRPRLTPPSVASRGFGTYSGRAASLRWLGPWLLSAGRSSTCPADRSGTGSEFKVVATCRHRFSACCTGSGSQSAEPTGRARITPCEKRSAQAAVRHSLTRVRSRHGPASARRPSRLRNPPSVTAARRPQLIRRNGGRRRAASASARGPRPCGLNPNVRPTRRLRSS